MRLFALRINDLQLCQIKVFAKYAILAKYPLVSETLNTHNTSFMKTLLSLALEVGDSAICESVLGKRLYAQHVESRISQNVCVFPIRDHDKLRSDYFHIRSSGRPAWVAMAYARSSQQQ